MVIIIQISLGAFFLLCSFTLHFFLFLPFYGVKSLEDDILI